MRHDETTTHQIGEADSEPSSGSGSDKESLNVIMTKDQATELRRAKKLVSNTEDKMQDIMESIQDLDIRMNYSMRHINKSLLASNDGQEDSGKLMSNLEEIKKSLLPQMQRMAEAVKTHIRASNPDGQDVFEELQ